MQVNNRSIFPATAAASVPTDSEARTVPGTELTYYPEDLTEDGKLSLIITTDSHRKMQRLKKWALESYKSCDVSHTLQMVNGFVVQVPVRFVPNLVKKLGDDARVMVDATIEYPQPSTIVQRQGLFTDVERPPGSGGVAELPGTAATPIGPAGEPVSVATNPASIPKDVDRDVLGMQSVWDKGYTGKGVTIAIIDSGIHPHDDMKDRIIGWKDIADDKKAPYDNFGHGTHVAGDAAGNGARSAGKLKGAAPEANLVGVRITKVAEAIKGLQWVIENKDKYNIKVVNMSLGDFATRSYKQDLWAQACEKAIRAGLIVVVAAGNEGPDPGSISTPGIDPEVITVGAIDTRKTSDEGDDTIAEFSSRGPTSTDNLDKPDVVAPGVSVFAPLAPRSTLDVPELPHLGKDYIAISGTSMATPFVSGLIATMLQANPQLDHKAVKEILMKTARKHLREDKQAQGAGLVFPAEAIKAALEWKAPAQPAPPQPTPSAPEPAPPRPPQPSRSPEDLAFTATGLRPRPGCDDLVCNNPDEWICADGSSCV